MAPQASKKCGLLPPQPSHEQRHQFGIGSWHLLRTHDLIGLSMGISTKRGKFLSGFKVLVEQRYPVQPRDQGVAQRQYRRFSLMEREELSRMLTAENSLLPRDRR